jgi:hypothetical protein
MHKGLVWGAVAALSLSVPAFADEFSYSYLDLGYINTQYDGGGNSDGLGVGGSLKLTDRLHLIGSYTTEDLEDFDIDAKSYTIGAGLRWPLSPNLDIQSTLSYIHTDIGSSFGSFDDDGLQVGLGLRGRVAPQLELTGKLLYTDFDKGGNDTSPSFGARYYFNNNFAIVADATLFDGGNQYFLGGRLNLGK